MKDGHFVFAFLVCYFLSLDAAMLNQRAGAVAFFGSVAGLTITMATSRPEKKVE